MAALPYMPLFVADYLADTPHLTTAQHGAYLLLIMNYWQRGAALPNDDARLSRIARMSRRDWDRNKCPIMDMFEVVENHLVHGRIASELSRVASKSLKCKGAAQASVERRFGRRSADVEPTDTDKNNTLAKANAVDIEKVMFDQGIAYLVSAGVKADRARSMLGRWKRDHGAGRVIEALGAAQRHGAIGPIPFIEGRFGKAQSYDPDRITV